MSAKSFKFCPICKSEMQLSPENYLACTNAECNFIFYDNPTPVVAAIVEYGEKQIVLAHNKMWPPTWFALITGFLEKNEHPEEAVLREVKEELGLDGEIGSFIGHYTFSRMNQIILAYHVKTNTQNNIVLNEELDDYKIIPFDKVVSWPSGTGYALRDFLEGQGYEVRMTNFE